MGQNGSCNGGSHLLVRLFLGLGAAAWCYAAGPLVNFDRDVRPILSDNCFACHGPDEKRRVANLRLDTEDGPVRRPRELSHHHARRPREEPPSGAHRRRDTRRRMPPPQAGTTLTPAQIATIRQWVEQGAKWERHWAFRAAGAPRHAVSQE